VTAGRTLVRNVWTVAAWSHELASGKPLARTLLDQPVVLYRGASGRVVAMEDRCPHRAAPLALGRCEGDSLRCAYHGLLFDPSGECVELPHHERPPRLPVRTYPVIERDRLVWIWCGDPAKAAGAEPEDCHWLASAGWRGVPSYLRYECSYLLIADNLLDFSHAAYLHPGTLGTPGVAAVRQQVERVGARIRVTRHQRGIDPMPLHQKAGQFTGKVDMWQEYDWVAPYIMTMDAGSATAGAGGLEGRREGAVRFRHLTLLTPETECSTHYFYVQLRNFALHDPAMDQLVARGVDQAFGEDQRMIEAQQRVIDRDPQRALGTMGTDRGVVEMRRAVEELLAAEAS